MSNTSEIIGKFISMKECVHPQTGQPLSKRKRMDAMYGIATNSYYQKNFTKEERLLATDLIKEIIKEE